MIELYYRILKHDPEGRLVKDTGLIPSHSYVIQFLELIEGFFTQPVERAATDYLGVERAIYRGDRDIVLQGKVSAAVAYSINGIVVGTNAGETAEGNEDYSLDTQIEHSATGEAGKMNYQAVILTAPGVVGPNVDFDVARPFINETDATITVKEIGIQCLHGGVYRHLLLRDVVTAEDVLAGYTLTVVYTLRTTV
ncbi:MAG: hypothetical protein CEE41_04370 [Hadesarchaea archaeon B3_Hades]|nr:MAG: hypothetical protein CEE41_04370 [Hadesarchaea archaeon B3_Hades]